jgi:hypothetical protein
MPFTQVLAFALALFFTASTTCALHAQQNLFNIPSGDITPTGEWFYQHQLNFYEIDDLETKSHFVYGIAEGWDVGINFIDLPLRLSGEATHFLQRRQPPQAALSTHHGNGTEAI